MAALLFVCTGIKPSFLTVFAPVLAVKLLADLLRGVRHAPHEEVEPVPKKLPQGEEEHRQRESDGAEGKLAHKSMDSRASSA